MLGEKVAVVTVRDHFSSEDKDQDPSVGEFVGIIESETEEYLILRHVKADVNDPQAAAEYHHLYKPAIVDRWIFELTPGNVSYEKR